MPRRADPPTPAVYLDLDQRAAYERARRQEYAAYLDSLQWKDIRRRAFALNPRCRACGAQDGLHVHHLHYRTFRQERLSDLAVLCERCHDLVHSTRRRNESVANATIRVIQKGGHAA